jgi:hypothetical protein
MTSGLKQTIRGINQDGYQKKDPTIVDRIESIGLGVCFTAGGNG